MTPEGTVKAEIKTYLKTLAPRLWFFSPFMSGYGASGIPDIIGVYKGRFFAIEVKAPGGRPTVWQMRMLAGIARAGGLAIVADNVEMVREAFEPFK